jgi:hypothetical protein
MAVQLVCPPDPTRSVAVPGGGGRRERTDASSCRKSAEARLTRRLRSARSVPRGGASLVHAGRDRRIEPPLSRRARVTLRSAGRLPGARPRTPDGRHGHWPTRSAQRKKAPSAPLTSVPIVRRRHDRPRQPAAFFAIAASVRNYRSASCGLWPGGNRPDATDVPSRFAKRALVPRGVPAQRGRVRRNGLTVTRVEGKPD